VTWLRALRHQTFSSLAVPNYRRYVVGQSISLVGTWMQSVAQGWLVYTLTNSATALGLVIALQTLPVLLLGPYAGVVADRVDKRKLMMVLQALMGLIALVLGVLTVTHVVTLWEVYVLAVLLGLNNTFENPARQTFVLEMVGPKDLRNAVSLNSVLVNVARAVGPAVAGLLITLGGTGICFLINAASFGAVVASLYFMDLDALQPSRQAVRAKGQLRQGLSYVRHEPELFVPLVMMALVGCLAYEFQVVLPVLAKATLHGGAQEYGFLTGAMGVGAVVGGLWTAARGRTGLRPMVTTSFIFGLLILAAALAPTTGVELVVIAFVGAGSVSFLSKSNSTLQLASAPEMRGRVMALWAVAFLGSTPIGGPIAGYVSATLGARAALVMGAASCFVAAAIGLLVVRRAAATSIAEPVEEPVPVGA
jgi:MFS family permease